MALYSPGLPPLPFPILILLLISWWRTRCTGETAPLGPSLPACWQDRGKKEISIQAELCLSTEPFLWLPALSLCWIAGAALLCACPGHWTVLISSDRAPLSWKFPPAVWKHHRMIVWGKCLLALSLDLWVHLGRCGGSHSSLPLQVCQQVGFYCKFGGKGVRLSKTCFTHISVGVINHWNDDHMAGSLCLLNL